MSRITIEGTEQVDARLATIENAERHLEPPMERSVDRVHVRVRANTPVDTGRLVGNLGRFVRTHGRGVTGSVFYLPTYGPYGHRYDHYVKGPGLQAYMHRGRVTTIADDLDAERDIIVAEFDAAIEGLVNG